MLFCLSCIFCSCGCCKGESHSDVPVKAPCPERMDLYLSNYHAFYASIEMRESYMVLNEIIFRHFDLIINQYIITR